MGMDLGMGIGAKPKSKFDIPDLDLDSLGDLDLEGDFDMSAFSGQSLCTFRSQVFVFLCLFILVLKR